jgi:hypothetical protein
MNRSLISRIASVLLVPVLLLLAGCGMFDSLSDAIIQGSGNVVTQEYDFTNFDSVELSHAFQGTITQGDSFSVAVRIDDNLVDRLEVTQNGNTVHIGLDEVSITNNATMEAEITLPHLSEVHASGASQIQLNGISSTEPLRVEASGASQVHGDVAAGDLTLDASGASTVSLAGTGGNVRANSSGASTIDLEELTAADADVQTSGASRITVNASGRLDAEASGGSNVSYVGNPTMGNINTSGGSEVNQR